MNTLMEILKKHEVEDFAAAEMIYAYLMEYGDSNDDQLKEDLYQKFLKSDAS